MGVIHMADVVSLIVQRVADGLAAAAANFVTGAVTLIVTLIVMIIGYVIAKLIAVAWERFLKMIKLEEEIKKHGLHNALLGLTITSVTSAIIQIFVIVLALGVAANIAGVQLLTKLSKAALEYISIGLVPGAIVLVVTMLAAEFITNKIKASKDVPFANLIGLIVEVFIVYNGVVIAIPQLLPSADVSLLKSAFNLAITTLVLSVGLGGAIAIGLGLKDSVSELAERKRKDLEKVV